MNVTYNVTPGSSFSVIVNVYGEAAGGASSPYGTDFAMEVETTTASETFTIRCQNVGVFDASVDWGDGNVSAITSFDDANLTHTYAIAGLHEIRVSGSFPNISYNNTGDKNKVTRVMQLGNVGWQTLGGAFRGCLNLTSFESGTCDTSAATSMFGLIMSCPNLATVDVSTLNTSSVTTMAYMFQGLPVTTLDLSNLDTSSVADFSHMFRNSNDIITLDLSTFDTSSATNMRDMFNSMGVVDVVGIDTFDISKVTNFVSFAHLTTLPTARYDAILTAWDAQIPKDGQTVTFGSSKYSAGAPATARANLIADHSWDITDGGLAA